SPLESPIANHRPRRCLLLLKQEARNRRGEVVEVVEVERRPHQVLLDHHKSLVVTGILVLSFRSRPSSKAVAISEEAVRISEAVEPAARGTGTSMNRRGRGNVRHRVTSRARGQIAKAE